MFPDRGSRSANRVHPSRRTESRAGWPLINDAAVHAFAKRAETRPLLVTVLGANQFGRSRCLRTNAVAAELTEWKWVAMRHLAQCLICASKTHRLLYSSTYSGGVAEAAHDFLAQRRASAHGDIRKCEQCGFVYDHSLTSRTTI